MQKSFLVAFVFFFLVSLTTVSFAIDGASSQSSNGDVFDLNFQLERTKVYPGETLKITGFAKDMSGAPLKKAQVRLMLGNAEYKTKIRNGELNYDFEVPELVPSGKQHVLVNVKDDDGNVEDTILDIEIIPVPSEIEFMLSQVTYQPLEAVETMPLLKDQAGDLMPGEINVLLKDGRRVILSQTVPSEELLRLFIPKYSKPGEYTLLFRYKDAETKKEIEVERYIKAEILLENQIIVVENSGNVDDKDLLEVFAGEERIFSKIISLNVGEAYEIDLSTLLQTGNYAFKVVFGDDEGVFENVNILGKKHISITWFYKFIVIFLIVFLIYAFWERKGEIVNHFSFGSNKKKHPFDSSTTQYREESTGRPRFSSREEEIHDFKERTLRGIRETERERKKKASDESNMFRMFD